MTSNDEPFRMKAGRDVDFRKQELRELELQHNAAKTDPYVLTRRAARTHLFIGTKDAHTGCSRAACCVWTVGVFVSIGLAVILVVLDQFISDSQTVKLSSTSSTQYMSRSPAALVSAIQVTLTGVHGCLQDEVADCNCSFTRYPWSRTVYVPFSFFDYPTVTVSQIPSHCFNNTKTPAPVLNTDCWVRWAVVMSSLLLCVMLMALCCFCRLCGKGIFQKRACSKCCLRCNELCRYQRCCRQLCCKSKRRLRYVQKPSWRPDDQTSTGDEEEFFEVGRPSTEDTEGVSLLSIGSVPVAETETRVSRAHEKRSSKDRVMSTFVGDEEDRLTTP